ncbi:hypothetical protein [Streptomyces sp. NPDC026673]|uniref:hypothetical protein n=1 Tax=Streptomyces sp. NPDC026673 TaxID=3155724 RepID=UPI0033C1BFBB
MGVHTTLTLANYGGGIHKLIAWITKRGTWLPHSVCIAITDANQGVAPEMQASAWTPATESGGEIRDSA